MHRQWNVVSLIAALLAIPAAALAEDAGNEVKACRSEPDDAHRLACYDRAVERMHEGDASTAAGPVAAEPALSPEERFGRTGAMTRAESDRKENQARELDELEASVTEVWTRSDGLMSITLDNGQVWKQNRPDPFFRIRIGDKVKIQPAALGSFLLSGPSNRSTRVTRTK